MSSILPNKLPGLNGLRAYAALSVLAYHISTAWNSRNGNIPEVTLLDFFFLDGTTAVTLFFVLSGFLITHLLLREQQMGGINAAHFYMRRMLRIFPLYYAVLVIGVLIVPVSEDVIRLAVGMLPELAFVALPMGVIAHLWSIGIEETFYISYPALVKTARRHLPYVLIGVIIVKLVAFELAAGTLQMLLFYARFDSMAIGALGAWLLYQRAGLALRVLRHRAVQAAALVLIAMSALLSIGQFNAYFHTFISGAFLVVILNAATTSRPIMCWEHPVLDRLGQISYGIYMWHPLLLHLLILALDELGIRQGIVYHALLYVLATGGTLIIANASYRWLEMPFLRLKARYNAFTPHTPITADTSQYH